MRVSNFVKYVVATAAVALSFSSASADKIAFVGDEQSYSGGGDVVTLPVGSKPGINYGTDKPVTFQIPVENSTAQIVFSNGINWPSTNSELVLTPAAGVVVNSVTFSCHSNYGEIALDGSDLKQTPSSSNPLITFSDLDATDALVFTHTRQNRFYYIEVEYNSASQPGVESVDLNAKLSPETIPADYDGEVRMTVGGIWAEFGTEMQRSTFDVEIKTATGVSTTAVTLSAEYDWSTGEDYYLLKFAKPYVEGTYTITLPEGAFVRKNDDGEVMVKSNAQTFKLTVTKAGSVDPEVGFIPNDTYPAAGSTVDPSESDWMIALYFDQKVTTDQTITPYLLLDDQKYEADSFMDMAAYSNPKQVNVFFDGMNQRPNGTYTFVLPAGAVSYENGQTNNSYTTTFKWEGGKSGDIGDVDCKILSASIGSVDIMKAGAVVPNIPAEDCYMKIAVEPEDIVGIIVSIVDVTGLTPDKFGDLTNEAVWVNTMETKVGNTFSKQIYSIDGIKLYNDKTYVVKAELCNVLYPIQSKIATLYSATFTGETDAFKYSPVEIVSIEPAPGSEFKVGDKMVVTYSAPVKLVAGEGKSGFGKGNAGWANFTSMGSNADKTVWTISFPAAEINAAGGPGQINPRLWGTDENGYQLRPAEYDIPAGAPETDYLVFNGGENESTYTQVNYTGYAKCPKVEVSPLATEELSYIDFKIVGNKEMNPSYLVEFPEVKNAVGEVVAVVLVDGYADESEESTGHIIVTSSTGSDTSIKVTGIRVPLNNVITTPGTYTLELPWNLFVVGSEFDSHASAPGIYEITVGDPSEKENLSFSCESGNNMTSTFIPADEEEELPAYYMITIEAKNDIAEVTVAIPEGYDSMYYATMDPGSMKRVAASEMEEYGYTKGNVIPVPADGKEHIYNIAFSKGGDVDTDNSMMLIVKADKLTGIEGIVNEAVAAEYYTIDGLKVEKPVKGLYIKVKEGKTSKVVL